MPSRIIVINGLPGTGKTTLAKKLTEDLKIPLITKDEIKEFFFDTLRTDGHEQSRMIGRVSVETIYILIDHYLQNNLSLIIECPFYVDFARNKIKASLEKYEGDFFELYCQLPNTVRKQRILDRLREGGRHQQHIPGDTTDVRSEAELLATYAPLKLGQLVEINTEHFGESEYSQLLKRVKNLLEV